jgi:hypothetical protein
MTLPLLYANNADVKYPLDAFHEAPIPNDLLLDLCLSIEDGYQPVLTALRVTPYLTFVAIEDQLTGAPLATAAVERAQMAVVYPLTMQVRGSGWIVFGPGVSRGGFNAPTAANAPMAVALDPETVVQLKTVAPLFSLKLNREEHELANTLALLLANEVLVATVQGNTLYLDRNDAILSDTQIADLTTASDQQDLNKYVFSIGGVTPDENGNVDIDVEGCLENCKDVWSLNIPRSDLGMGEYGELPLDNFAVNEFQPTTPCYPSDDGSSTAEDPFDQCRNIVKIDIEDADFRKVGTLYTIEA